jgi:RecA/RadA recombinase
MSDLLKKMLSLTDNTYADVMSTSTFFADKKDDKGIVVDVPLLNIALSGKIDEGLREGILMISGESKRFKTLFGLYLLSAFQKKYKDGVCIFYDTEFGTPPSYLTKFNLDLKRIIHIPIDCVEALKHDIMKKIDGLKEEKDEENKVLVFVDSLGALASRKEIDDALEGNEKTDMTRAKAIKSLFRIITANLNILGIPMIVINHCYKEQTAANPKYARDIVGGGQAVQLAPDVGWIIQRQQDKEDDEIKGYKFIINIDKSRYMKDRVKLPITVRWESGIHKYSGLSDLAIEFKIIEECKLEDVKGKPAGLKFNKRIIPMIGQDLNKEFWEDVIKNSELSKKIEEKYKL